MTGRYWRALGVTVALGFGWVLFAVLVIAQNEPVPRPQAVRVTVETPSTVTPVIVPSAPPFTVTVFVPYPVEVSVPGSTPSTEPVTTTTASTTTSTSRPGLHIVDVPTSLPVLDPHG